MSGVPRPFHTAQWTRWIMNSKGTHELEGYVVVAGHVDLARLDGGEHARRPVVGDNGAADDHELLVVLADQGVNGVTRVALKVAVLHSVLADEGEEALAADQRREWMHAG